LHGGGFAGTIQAYVENEHIDEFAFAIEAVFGNGSCKVLSIRKHGTVIIKENEILD
jgi:galactokinase